jgi:hypothetical protein
MGKELSQRRIDCVEEGDPKGGRFQAVVVGSLPKLATCLLVEREGPRHSEPDLSSRITWSAGIP